MAEVHYSCGHTLTELPNGRRYVLVKLILTCPICGEITMEIPGHHLRKIVELLSAKLIEHLELTTNERAEAEVKELQALMATLLKPTPEETTH